MSRFLNSGLTGTNGVTLVVDGIEATRVPVSPSAIQQVKINQDPYSAEFIHYTGSAFFFSVAKAVDFWENTPDA
jgi:hypothetical protein